MTMRFANAPISYGVFGDLTLGDMIPTSELLQTMRDAGYEGSELGPPGFFGSPEGVRQKFEASGLTAVGAYVPLHTQLPGRILERDFRRLTQTLDELEAVNPGSLVILADEGAPELLSMPRKDPRFSLQQAAWNRLIEVVQRAAETARRRGFVVSFHPHIATYVELPEEIERFLDDTDVSLTYDIGHVVLAGGSGVELFERWSDRVNHVHLKDVKPSVLEKAREAKVDDLDTWFPQACTRLGEGESQLSDFANSLAESGYDGWVVVEQDRDPVTPETYSAVVADQRTNYNWLTRNLAGESLS